MNQRKGIHALLGKTFLIIGMSFLVPSLICLGISVFLTGGTGEAALSLQILSVVFALICAGFALAGGILRAVAIAQRRRAEELKRIGICYDARVVRMYENYFVRINRQSPLVAECVYTDKNMKNCLVKSSNLWLSPVFMRPEDLTAKVWVHPDNPKSYYLEIHSPLDRTAENVQIDHDYR